MKLYSALYNHFDPLKTWFPELPTEVINPENMKKELNAPGLLISWGGADIHPSLYNRPNIQSHVGQRPSERDVAEQQIMALAIERGIPILGVCRGAQLACAMAGGILVQHTDGHEYGHHRMSTDTGECIMTSSAHHQMMFPWDIKYEPRAWSTLPKGTVYVGITDEELSRWPTKRYNDDTVGVIEPEVVWFPEIKCLGVQGHPEWMDPHCPFNQYVRRTLSAYVALT